MVTQVQNSSLASAGTANDVLRKTPGVVDDGDGLKVLGRGTPEVYINGRKVRDASELDQLASGNIRNVEVVTNPGARYDASVKAVIRIQTKKA
ncbi:TonB-dependent receptor plug domain-containing protein [uncultured Bacteroides sp.]|nr:TonB-dependent receptor plug domain-containing protein [uncultured Bacteroides sp.]